jgi:uncharacterized RDD family membrane protein YckC
LSGVPIPFARGAAAPAIDYANWNESVPQAPAAASAAELRQGQLFDGQDAPRLLRMPLREKPAGSRVAGPRAKTAVRQQSLFPSVLPLDAAPGDSTIYCGAPVALPVHRIMAFTVDASMVLISLGIFAGIFVAGSATIVVNQSALLMYGAAVAVTLTVYRLMWCLANTDSIGMRSCGLRLITFDGLIPERKQRVQRLIASYVSVMPGGLGLLWALADEEKLTWHDHMSKTFPTPAVRKARPLEW